MRRFLGLKNAKNSTILTSADAKTTKGPETCILDAKTPKGHHVLTLLWLPSKFFLKGNMHFFNTKLYAKCRKNGMRDSKTSNEHVTLEVVDSRDEPHTAQTYPKETKEPTTQSGLCKKIKHALSQWPNF